MSLEKYGETIIMKDHLCWVQMFGAYPSGNDQLLKDFIGNRMQCDQSFSKTTLERKLETIVETVEIEKSPLGKLYTTVITVAYKNRSFKGAKVSV